MLLATVNSCVPLGLYVLKEGLTKEFLAQFFKRTDGNLYDGGFRHDVDWPLERIHGDGADGQADRLSLVAAARAPGAARRWQRLQRVLDVDRFMTSLALQTVTWNWNGYGMARNNFRLESGCGLRRRHRVLAEDERLIS